MQRVSHPELDDQPWLPRSVRDGFTDYLRFMTVRARPYRSVVGSLADAIRASGAHRVVDLASGGGGPWPQLHPELVRRGVRTNVTLTDRYPNRAAAKRLGDQPGIAYRTDPVDARSVPADLTGFRTMFSSFHHFEPDEAKAILRDAAEHAAGIAVFEVVARQPMAFAAAPFVPLPLLVLAPVLQPFRVSRLFWTYLAPVLPMVLAWDALASVRKAYTAEEMLALARAAAPGYGWQAGRTAASVPAPSITYLIGTRAAPS